MFAKILIVILLWKLAEISDGAAVKLYNQNVSKNSNMHSNTVKLTPNAFLILIKLSNSNNWHKIILLPLSSLSNASFTSAKKNSAISSRRIYASKNQNSKGRKAFNNKFNTKVSSNFSKNTLYDDKRLVTISNGTQFIEAYYKRNFKDANSASQNSNRTMMVVKNCGKLYTCGNDKPTNKALEVDIASPSALDNIKAKDFINEDLTAYDKYAEEYITKGSEDMERLMPIMKRISNTTKIPLQKIQNLLENKTKLRKLINKVIQYSFINPDNHVMESQILSAVQNNIKEGDKLSKLFLNTKLNVK